MGIKMVVTSDWHFDAVTAGYPRIDEITDALIQSVETGRKHAIDYYIMLGDLCNPNNARSYKAIATAIDRLDYLYPHAMVMFITGNHDVIEDGSGDHVMLPIEVCGDYTVFSKPEIRVVSPGTKRAMNVVALPFTPSSHDYDPTDFIMNNLNNLDSNNKTVVLSHLNIEGIGPGSETENMPRGRDVFLPLEIIKEYIPDAVILNGHYHKQQTYCGVHIPGSLVRLTFGEANNKPGFLLLEM